jgi:DNA-binding transcriptional MocR family regulator
VQLPENVDALDLYVHALRAGVTLAPGDLFSATRQYRNFIRLNAAMWNREVERAIERLGDLATNL